VRAPPRTSTPSRWSARRCFRAAAKSSAEGVLAIEMGANATDIGLSIHPHPTLSETIMEAAEGLHGTASSYYQPRKKPQPR